MILFEGLPHKLALIVALIWCGTVQSKTLTVGPGALYRMPCDAIAAAQSGDTIEIEAAGDYSGDVCGWSTDRLTIRGIHGRAHIDAAGKSAQAKAIWVIGGNDTIIENIELSGAAVPDRNGAGIRQQGRNLTIRHCYFHDNEDGILAGDAPGSEILLEYTELAYNGAGDGFSHNIYVNHVARFTMRFCYSHHSRIGHLVKSRAAETYLFYNRFSDEATGTGSYEVNLPNGGRAVVLGNIIQQGPLSSNGGILTYLDEGPNPANPDTSLYVVNNTFVNDRRQGGTFLLIAVSDATPAVVRNNIFSGPGTIVTQLNAILENNLVNQDPLFRDPLTYDYHLQPRSPAIEGGSDPGRTLDLSLTPLSQYVHTACSEGRQATRTIDIGAYQFAGEAFDPGSPPQCRRIAAGGIVNGATLLPGPVAPGSIVVILGANLASESLQALSFPLPLRVANTAVHCNGISAPLLMIGAAKLIVQLPYEIPPGDATATVDVEGATTAPVDFVIAATAPGIFGVLNGDGTPNSPRNPTPGGAEVAIYFTGAGFAEPTVPTGTPAIGDHRPIAAVRATIAAVDAQVTWFGLVPGFAGLAQANIRTPSLGDGDWPLVLIAGDIASPPAMISISSN